MTLASATGLRPHLAAMLVMLAAASPLHAQVATPQPHSAPETYGWGTITVPGTPSALLNAARLAGTSPRSYVLSDVARAMYESMETADRIPPVLQYLQRAGAAAAPNGGFEVPLPLGPAIWTERIFDGRAKESTLATAILSDPRAALLYLGLLYADRSVLQFLDANPAVVERLYRDAAPAFAVYSSSLRLRDGAVVVPGGATAAELWRRLVGSEPSVPARFIPSLLTRDEGRIAAFFDMWVSLDEQHAAFVLASGANLYEFLKIYPAVQWMPTLRPRSTLSLNPGSFLSQVLLSPDGAIVGASTRGFWEAVLGVNERDTRGLQATSAAGVPLDAAWIVQRILVGPEDTRDARNRFDAFLFAQRVFPILTPDSVGDAVTALRGFARFPMLLLTLERIGIVDPHLYAASVRRASTLNGGDAVRASTAQALFQGALALVERLRASRALSAKDAADVIAALVAVEPTGGRYSGRLVDWMDRQLLPRVSDDAPLSTEGAADRALIAALAGVSRTAAQPPVVQWEGFRYVVDVADAQRRRMINVWERQKPLTVANVEEVAAIVGVLQRPGMDAAALAAARDRLAKLAAAISRPRPGTLNATAERGLRDAAADLAGVRLPQDAGDITGIATRLQAVVDYVMGSMLQSLAYTPHILDPDLPLLLDGDISVRHDYFFMPPAANVRQEAAWTMPVVTMAVGIPWHVSGSLLGLDIALGHLALRKTSDGLPPAPASWSIADRDALAAAHAVFAPFSVDAGSMQVIAEAVRAGRARETQLPSLPAGSDVAGIPDARIAAVAWSAEHDPAAVPGFIGMSDLLLLGLNGSHTAALSSWGSPAWPLDGSLRLRAMPPRSWESLRWRPPAGAFAAHFPDISLRVAELLAELNLPAAIAVAILPQITRDVIDGAAPVHPNDWGSVVRFVRALRLDQIEDYVAAEAAGGALVPATDQASAR